MLSTHTALRLLSAALAGSLCLAPAWAGDRMIGSELTATFRGMTLEGTYNDGEDTKYRETYNPDGTILYHDEDHGDQNGVWAVNGNTFCTYYEGIPGSCFQVTTEGTNCFSFTAVAFADRPAPPNDWTARGWNNNAASSCPN